MNVKNLAGAAIINTLPATKGANGTEKTIKSENTHDRDANGQSMYEQHKKKQKMNREQAEKAVANLNAKHFMQDMKWVAVLLDEDGYYFVEVKDTSGKLIRKISEFDLWEMYETPPAAEIPSQKGNLLKRLA